MLISSCLDWVQKQRLFLNSLDAMLSLTQTKMTMKVIGTPSGKESGIIIAAIDLSLSFLRDSAHSATNVISASHKPNIIFILADDLGYGDLGCYGQTRIKTPNIDKLASEGIRFTDCYAASTVCAPSRCALMTGLHTGHNRIRGNGAGLALAPEDVTVAVVLKRVGCHTALVGKWGLTDDG
jgi:hypothetical protein